MPAHFQRLPTTHASLMITLWLLSREARISMSSLPPKAPTKWPKGLRFSTLHFKVDGFLYETSIVLVFGLWFVTFFSVFVHFRAIFNLVAKVIRVCFNFALFWSVIGPSRHLLNQSDTIRKPVVNWPPLFSCVFHPFLIFPMSAHWLMMMSPLRYDKLLWLLFVAQLETTLSSSFNYEWFFLGLANFSSGRKCHSL